jgi:hypothetical protein
MEITTDPYLSEDRKGRNMSKLVFGLSLAIVYIAAIILLGGGQPPKPEEMVQTTEFRDCIQKIGVKPDGSPIYAGIRFYRGPIPASVATAEAQATPTPRSAENPGCQVVPAATAIGE